LFGSVAASTRSKKRSRTWASRIGRFRSSSTANRKRLFPTARSEFGSIGVHPSCLVGGVGVGRAAAPPQAPRRASAATPPTAARREIDRLISPLYKPSTAEPARNGAAAFRAGAGRAVAILGCPRQGSSAVEQG